MAVRFISDLHLGHANMMKYEPSRPGTTVEEMDEEIVRRWNETVEQKDTTYILGDVSWRKVAETVRLLSRMNGEKILVRGNHDHESELKKGVGACFSKVTDYAVLRGPKECAHKIVLSHFPIPFFDSAERGAVHLYGHVHNSEQYRDIENLRRTLSSRYDRSWRMYNVGCMMPYMGFSPRTLEEIVEGVPRDETLAPVFDPKSS